MTGKLFNIIVFIILINCTGLFSQTWERTYGSIYWDGGGSVQQTNNGMYIVSGYTSSYGILQDGLYLIKTDKYGNTEWTKIYGDIGCGGRSIQQTSDFGYISVGSCWSGNFYCVKTDSLGDSLWVREYGTNNLDGAYSVCQASDGGYAILGYTRVNDTKNRVYLIKIDSIGDTMWTRIYGSSYCEGRSIEQTPDNGFIITGTIYPTGHYDNIYLIKTDSIGDTIWARMYGDTIPSSVNQGYDVKQTSDGGYIVIGSMLLKTDSLGDSLWAKPISGVAGQQTSDGGYVIVSTSGTYPYTDVCLTKTDSTGNIEWSRTFGGDSTDFGYSVQQTTDRGYIVTGETYSYGAGECDVYLIKTDSIGYVGVEEEPEVIPEDISYSFISCRGKDILFRFVNPSGCNVDLKIYDVTGRFVANPIEGYYVKGEHEENITLYSYGIYIYRLKISDIEYSGKVIVF